MYYNIHLGRRKRYNEKVCLTLLIYIQEREYGYRIQTVDDRHYADFKRLNLPWSHHEHIVANMYHTKSTIVNRLR